MGKDRVKNREKRREKKEKARETERKSGIKEEILHAESLPQAPAIEKSKSTDQDTETAPQPAPQAAGKEECARPLNSLCYVDYENLFYSTKKMEQSLCVPKLVRILNKLSREVTGEGFYKTAVYANWDSIVPLQRHAQDDWNLVGWHTIAVPTREDYWSGQAVKNLVDFVMSLDSLEDAYTMPVDIVFLVSGDKDFVEVVERLKRKKVKVVVVSLKPNLSFRLQEAADEFMILNYEQITGDEPPPLDTYQKDRRMARRQQQSPSYREPEDEFQLLRKSIERAERDQNMSPILWNVVRDEYFLKETRMTLDEANVFMQQLQEVGFVKLIKKAVPGKGIFSFIELPR
jgi:uncharacterized LabA/DUF88 family protein